MALLGACRIHGKVELGEWIGKELLELDPTMAVGYMVLHYTSMLLLAGGISVRIFKSRERKGVSENSQIAPGLK